MTATDTRGCATYSWCVETDREHNTDDDDHYGEVATARAGERAVRIWADQRPGVGWVILLDDLEWRISAPNLTELGKEVEREFRDIRSIVDQMEVAITAWHANLRNLAG